MRGLLHWLGRVYRGYVRDLRAPRRIEAKLDALKVKLDALAAQSAVEALNDIRGQLAAILENQATMNDQANQIKAAVATVAASLGNIGAAVDKVAADVQQLINKAQQSGAGIPADDLASILSDLSAISTTADAATTKLNDADTAADAETGIANDAGGESPQPLV